LKERRVIKRRKNISIERSSEGRKRIRERKITGNGRRSVYEHI
jgi:hypothetical protein